MKKPRVLRIINRFNLGGPTYNVSYLTKFMEDEFDTLLVGGEKDDSEESSHHITESLGLNPLIIPEMKREINPKNDRIAYKKIKELIKEFKPDIVHTHASKAGAVGRLAASKMKVPVILHTFHGHVFHSYFGRTKTAFYKNVERTLAKRSTNIIAISNLQKEELSKVHRICPEDKIKVIPLGFDLNKFTIDSHSKRKNFRDIYNVKDNEIAICIVGRLVPVKNHELFLKAIKFCIENTNIPIRAFIVGDGELRQHLEFRANQLGLMQNNINGNSTLKFTSWVKDVDYVYAGCDIATLTSFNEGTPVSLIEAQAAGIPIVSTNVGGIDDVVLKDRSALLSTLNEEELFCNNLLKLIVDSDLQNEMKGFGREFVLNKFTYNILVNNTKNLYKELLDKR